MTNPFFSKSFAKSAATTMAAAAVAGPLMMATTPEADAAKVYGFECRAYAAPKGSTPVRVKGIDGTWPDGYHVWMRSGYGQRVTFGSYKLKGITDVFTGKVAKDADQAKALCNQLKSALSGITENARPAKINRFRQGDVTL